MSAYFWNKESGVFVKKITDASRYKTKPKVEKKFSTVKFGNSYVVYYSDKVKEYKKFPNIIEKYDQFNQLKLMKNPSIDFENDEQKEKFYDLARDIIRTATDEELTNKQIDKILDDENTGNILTQMLVKAIELRKQNRSLKKRIEESAKTDTRSAAQNWERENADEVRKLDKYLSDLRLSISILETEKRSLEDVRTSVRSEIENLKKTVSGIKNIEDIEEKLNRIREENAEELRRRGYLGEWDKISAEIARRQVRLEELEAANREGLIIRSDLLTFERLRSEIVSKTSELERILSRINESSARLSHFTSYDALKKEVEELESMKRYLDSDLAARRSRVSELSSEIEAMTIRRDRIFQEMRDAGAINLPQPSTSAISTPVPVVPVRQGGSTGRYRPPETIQPGGTSNVRGPIPISPALRPTQEQIDSQNRVNERMTLVRRIEGIRENARIRGGISQFEATELQNLYNRIEALEAADRPAQRPRPAPTTAPIDLEID